MNEMELERHVRLVSDIEDAKALYTRKDVQDLMQATRDYEGERFIETDHRNREGVTVKFASRWFAGWRVD